MKKDWRRGISPSICIYPSLNSGSAVNFFAPEYRHGGEFYDSWGLLYG